MDNVKKPWFRTDADSQTRLRAAADSHGQHTWNRRRDSSLTVGMTVEFYKAYGHPCTVFQAEIVSITPLHPRAGEKPIDEDVIGLKNVRIIGRHNRKAKAATAGA